MHTSTNSAQKYQVDTLQVSVNSVNKSLNEFQISISFKEGFVREGYRRKYIISIDGKPFWRNGKWST